MSNLLKQDSSGRVYYARNQTELSLSLLLFSQVVVQEVKLRRMPRQRQVVKKEYAENSGANNIKTKPLYLVYSSCNSNPAT